MWKQRRSVYSGRWVCLRSAGMRMKLRNDIDAMTTTPSLHQDRWKYCLLFVWPAQLLWNEKCNLLLEKGLKALVFWREFLPAKIKSQSFQCSVSCYDSYSHSRIGRDKLQHSLSCVNNPVQNSQHLSQNLTRIVVTMSVLFASVSETLISRLVEFMAKVLLEYQIPI